ncbi:MAG: low temperature requirement protein A [Kofleriaceae bacterium]|nr:low temperature requirement protein A [Kofleriaceae bacterium]
MQSRWLHRPRLHRPGPGVAEKRATWLELFYDLVFVAAFIQLGNALTARVSPLGYAGFALVFAAIWVSWTGFTYFVNRFTVDDFVHRLLAFAQMFAVVAMAVSAPAAMDGAPARFAIAFALAQAIIAVLYLRAYRQVPDGRAYARYWGGAFAVGSVALGLSAALPTPWAWGLWAVGLGWVVTAPFRRGGRTLAAEAPADEEHIGERYGLLTLIVIGESFVKVVTGLDDGAGAGALGPIVQASLALLITCSIWWIYFDDVAGSRLREHGMAPVFWLYGHLPLQLSITATGVAIKKIVLFDLAMPAPEAYRWLVGVALGGTLLATALLDAVTERKQAELSDSLRVAVRTGSGLLVLLLAPAGAGMDAGWYLGAIVAICVGQVLFDMAMAPFEVTREDHERETIADELRRLHAAGQTRRGPELRVGRGIVRLGTPSDLRRDFYFWLIEGGWLRFFAVAAVLFLVANAFFAGLYLLEPGSISNARPESFADAFYFSVQTLATIGYGNLNPATDYGNVIATVEAGVGLIGVALTTGLAFSRLARPKASVLFSRPIVVTTMDGTRVLTFRVGNARGNDVVEASVSVTAMVDTFTREGQHLRKLIDLPLRRSRSPMFRLSWTVMHDLDAGSPLADVDWSAVHASTGGRLVGLNVTLVGHDGTYNQTIYAQYTYQPEDVHLGHRFVDVVSQLPDGRMAIDFSRFHDTVPEAAAPSSPVSAAAPASSPPPP